MILESNSFADSDIIPVRHTCDGDDVSPPLAWRDPPNGTEAFALIMDDPDAPGGTWVHWLLFNLPGSETHLSNAASGTDSLPAGATEATNSWGRRGYGGPCPPSGTHRYAFKLYALDGTLDLGPEATVAELTRALQGHVLAEAALMGRYARTQAGG